MTYPRFAVLSLVFILSLALGYGGLTLTGCGRFEAPIGAAQQLGARVHSLVPTGPGAIFGLKKNDRLVGWRRAGAAGSIASPLDARRVEIEQAPAGGLKLLLFRQGEEVEIPVTSGRWEVELRPSEPNLTIEEDQQVEKLLEADLELAAESWLELSAGMANRGAIETARWFRHQAGRALALEDRMELAQAAFDASRLEYGPLDPGAEAMLLELEGRAWYQARRREPARNAQQRALELRRAGKAESLEVAASLVQLAEIDRLPDGKALFIEARRIFSLLAPDSADLAYVVNRLGTVASAERNLDLAHELYSESLELRRRAIPGSYRVADSLSNLGLVAEEKGRLDEAEKFFQQSLEKYPAEMLRPLALVGNGLASVLRDKGNYQRARETWEDSLSTLQRLDPNSAAVAGVLNNLGNLSLRLGDLDQAEGRYRESLALRRRLNPTSRGVAESLNNLGIVMRRQGQIQEARHLLEEALALKQQFASGTGSHANTLEELGNLAATEGRLEDAEARMREALAIRLEINPGSTQAVESQLLLARLLSLAGSYDEAVEYWYQGLDLLDQTRAAFQFSAQERSIFAARFQEHYRDLARLLVERHQPVEAFEVLERSRARALRTMATQRSTLPDLELPAFDWPTIQSALNPGTRLILFSVSQHETLIAVVKGPDAGDSGLHFHRVTIERDALRKKVELFRALVARGRTNPRVDNALLAQGQRLFDLLLSPVAEELASAKRLVVSPDLPLNTLPFTALLRSSKPVQFVGEWKPLSYVASGTLLASAKTRRPPSHSQPSIVVYAQGKARAPAGEKQQRLPPLPGAVAEARRIAEIFPQHSQILLDDQARESTLKGAGGTAKKSMNYLHFATHAMIDNRTPFDSALVLAPGEGEDGLLQAWEVIEQVRFDNDLVTLSACDTGLGKELGGEGVLGLSHAFLFSGARSVLTSLWPVSDASTAEWMASFYGNVRRGVDRDEAVFEAQIQGMGEGTEKAHPYYWAAFQLWGDWGS